ncbi:NAD(P)/FAD-dependent oxidoreductase [Halobaculum rubrum]|uniref:NAD(P)/FAD-dependent oxidoreductase n=1 Tax=Halobaculum rubrum TaxID=2872158 RepID=UPI001CA45656|nr:FAD-dependent oxidoreductase [Halobaculum rubrum]QZY00840.1 FAD-binding oxidoreductase [Halobaculum rubrum]
MHVAVVGGGIVGVASAYELAARGVDVTLFERGSLGAGSTDRALGGIRAQFSTRVNVELSVASINVWDAFEERFGVDIDRRHTGYLFCTRDPETADAFAEQVAMQNECGVASRTVSPEEAAELCPGLRAEEFVAGTYCPDDSFADPHLALQGYARAARGEGAEIRTNTPVAGLRPRESGVRVELTDDPDGTVTVDAAVNAAGAWAPRLAETAGYDLPIVPHRRQTAVVEPERPVPESDPLVIDADTTAHFRPERDGRALVGGHFGGRDPVVDADRFSETPDTDWAVEAVERAGDAADYFGPETRLAGGWAGLYAVTPDHHAIVEESVPGVVTAAGFSGHGFQHAPATATIVAELVLDGESSTVDASGLGRERFEHGDGPVERNVA